MNRKEQAQINEQIIDWLGGAKFYQFYQAKNLTELSGNGEFRKYINLTLAEVLLMIRYRRVPDIFSFYLYENTLNERGEITIIGEEKDCYGPDLVNEIFTAVRKHQEGKVKK
jgi:hypothetical protein